MASNAFWVKIFVDYKILEHNFNNAPFYISADNIKKSCQDLKKVAEKEVLNCVNKIQKKIDLKFLLKIIYSFHLLKMFTMPLLRVKATKIYPISRVQKKFYNSKLDFNLETSQIDDSNMKHLGFAYASSFIKEFMEDESLVLTIRGKKYTPEFSFNVGQQPIKVQSVQTEVDARFEGRDKIVLVEAKKTSKNNTISRQLFYPYKQWKSYKKKQFICFF